VRLAPPFTAKVEIEFSQRPVPAHNVVCLLPATTSGDPLEAIVLTAHYDHLGIGEPDARGDSLYNGFSDNAAGVAMLLAIADALIRSERPRRRPVLFLFFVGEESGLLGSDSYVIRPAWPLERVDAVINLDAGAPPARPWSWRIAGGDSSALGFLAIDVAMARGWSATTSAARANSDYFPFWASGVPAIFIVPGLGPYEGLTVDSSQALRRKWDRYHQPGDEWAEDFPFEGLGRYADYALGVVRALEERETLPRLAPSRRVR
jgi:Zn-dependent M28 family amino/carboxypeptidase